VGRGTRSVRNYPGNHESLFRPSERRTHHGETFEYDRGLTRPDKIQEVDDRVHSPRWGLGFQKMAQQRGATCYLRFPGHPSEKYADMWDFLVRQLGAGSQAEAAPGKLTK